MTSLSGLPKAIARVSESFVPGLRRLDGVLEVHRTELAPDAVRDHMERRQSGCATCDVTWTIDTSVPGEGARLISSRELTSDEVERLYEREGGS